LEGYRQAELALLGARFAFPDPHRPDVDGRSIWRAACWQPTVRR